MNFPMLAAENSEGRRFMLPQDFEGAYNVVVITFQQRQQSDVETWLPLLHRLSSHYEALHHYLLPTIQFLSDCQHEFLDVSANFRLSAQRPFANTLRLYVDLNDFNRALDIPTVSQIYTFLLDSSGRVLWRASGAYNPDCAHDLINLLDRLYPAPAAQRVLSVPQFHS